MGTARISSERGSRGALTVGTALAVLTCLVALLLVSGESFVFAQVTDDVQIINPHPDTTGDDPPELSTKEDTTCPGSDTPAHSYHLNSWVGQVPPNPRVEFTLDPDAAALPNIELGQAERSGDNNFELCTDLGGATDGMYALIATLFSGTNTVTSEDSMPVEVNNADEALPTTARAETVEITYPSNSGDLGFYIDNDNSKSFVIEGVASADTRFVKGYYTTSTVGAEPEWTQCGGYVGPQTDEERTPPAGTPAGSHFFQVTCDIGTQSGNNVTAVALLTNDTPEPAPPGQAQGQFDDSTDAHRVLPYFQTISTVDVEPPTHTVPAPLGDCSGPFTATVRDQFSRPIPGVNVDVHAKGPGDGLRFDVGATDTDENQPPDEGDHAREDPAWECDDEAENGGAAGGVQGEHNSQADPMDTKHIESVDDTDEDGQFTFAFRFGAVGVTKFRAFADADDDDVFCNSEPSDDGSVTWGAGGGGNFAAPGAEGPCTTGQVQPTPTTQSTTTSTNTNTGGGGTNTTTTTDTTSTTNTTDTTTTTTSTTRTTQTRREATNLTIRPKFRGAVGSSRKACQRGRAVKLKKHRRGRNKTVGTDRSNRAGNWKIRKRVRRGRFYAVVARKVFTAGNGDRIICQRDKSSTIRLRRR